ncbi:DUF1810 domain-containing protein [Pseudomonas sp. BBP2017]|uniref:DUF1810 domain-containing protein n=1 Tax=Pseudomonas sp. BBP2017 TaxID=2109731 RepID=UPI000D13770A|nr:DUF1810 domain-containing protein [Pseudomonas sp. BBP2017]PSS58615.1 DUF1810 domain-containing protein [Pseudomonas sp. BBP2017]
MPALFNLQRFVDAQDPFLDRVLAELQAGRKTSHWIWFIFPQLEGLGHSAMAERYALQSADEARAYLRHEVLRARLEQCVAAILQHTDKSAVQILGHTDDMKLRSCLTLFASVEPDHPLFKAALEQFYGAQPDPRTLQLLQT